MDKKENFRNYNWSPKAALLSFAQAAVYFILICMGTAILLHFHFFRFGMVKIIWSAIIIISFILVVRWNAKCFSWRCLKCKHEFDISAWTNFICPGGKYKYFIKCANCHKRTTAAIIDKIKNS